MPLFNKKFETKPIPARLGRCAIGVSPVVEDLDDFRTNISLNLGNRELRFADGIWIHTSRKSEVDEVVQLNKRVKLLESENNMCHIKTEVLLDLLTEHACELNALKANQK